MASERQRAISDSTAPHQVSQRPAARTASLRIAALSGFSIPAIAVAGMGTAQAAEKPADLRVEGTKFNQAGSLSSAAAARPAVVPASSVVHHVPATSVHPAAGPDVPASYRVKAGDTVWGIADRFKLDVGAIVAANHLNQSAMIHPGQELSLRPSEPAQAPATQAPAEEPAPAPEGDKYTIKAGDTLTSIAAAHSVLLQDLISANSLAANSTIYAGKQLTLPGRPAPAEQAAPVSEPKAAASSVTPLVPNTWGSYTYPDGTVKAANENKAQLNTAPIPSPEEMKQIISSTATQMGVDPSLALAFAWQESGFDASSVSPANAIGAMQVIPDSGEWASAMVGRHLNLLDPHDNATAGVALIRALVATSGSEEDAIAGYYQGQGSVKANGMFEDTKAYVANVKALQGRFR